MTSRSSTVRLSVADNFSQPLTKYAQLMQQAEQGTSKLAASARQAQAANAQMAQSATPVYDAFQRIRGQILPATALLTGFGITLRQAFAAGQEGAEISQTQQSFETMLGVIGAAPNLLEQLRTSARGTVDDMTLMASVQLLLAGTSGDLSTALADSTPQLLEMALAARKINPSLGDTQFLFDSIARGIKRSSPLILDNLGIVVKLGPAYKEYAEQIGKSADELSAEEKQMALLNAVLKQHDTLMKQAGGTTLMAGEAMAQLAANAANAGQAFKSGLAPWVERVATSLNALVFGSATLSRAFEQQRGTLLETTDSYDDYANEMLRAAVLSGRLNVLQANLIASWLNGDLTQRAAIESAQMHAEAIGLLTEEEYENRDATNEMESAHRSLNGELETTERGARDVASASDAAGKGVLGLGDAADRAGKQIGSGLRAELEVLEDRMGDLAEIVRGDVDDALADFEQRQADLRDRAAELQGRIDELNGKSYLTADQREQLEAWQTELGEVQTAITTTADEHEKATKRMLFNMAMDRAYKDGEYSPAEQAFLTSLAEAWGLKGEATELAIFGIDTALKNLAEGGTADAYREIGKLLDALGILPPSGTSWDWFFNVHTNAPIPAPPANPFESGVIVEDNLTPPGTYPPYEPPAPPVPPTEPRTPDQPTFGGPRDGGGGGGASRGGVTVGPIIVQAAPGMDVTQLAEEVLRIAAGKLRAAQRAGAASVGR